MALASSNSVAVCLIVAHKVGTTTLRSFQFALAKPPDTPGAGTLQRSTSGTALLPSLVGSYDDIVAPPETTEIDYEA
ncbi:hypothetical protein, partial [Rhodococcus sp. IEGM 1307]|uniref:hypothetical protein n=1 Tax=Rhodococcus sp. IEGM 1307 TaxID=3047091 RepID=UPI0024B81279